MKIIFWIRKIPVFGNLIWLANAYAYSGDRISRDQLAPPRLWFKAFFWNILIAFAAAFATLPDFAKSLFHHVVCGAEVLKAMPGAGANGGATIVSIFPNLLGLGIGIYALLYALDAAVVRGMHNALEAARRTGGRKHGSVLMLNSDMAFPLCALLLIIVLGVVTQFFPNNVWVQFAAWVAFWYGVLLILELVMLLFALIDNSLLGKIDTQMASPEPSPEVIPESEDRNQ